jgi:hypothetical protein
VSELLGRSAWWLSAALDRLYRGLGLSDPEDVAPGIRLETKGSVGS